MSLHQRKRVALPVPNCKSCGLRLGLSAGCQECIDSTDPSSASRKRPLCAEGPILVIPVGRTVLLAHGVLAKVTKHYLRKQRLVGYWVKLEEETEFDREEYKPEEVFLLRENGSNF